MEKEIRSFNIEFRAEPESREVNGYAIVFNSPSHNLGGFIEKVSPEAMNGVIERSDVVALLNHNQDRGILGRSRNGNGSLKLTVDDKGTSFRFDSPKTALGDEVLEYLRRGDATQCSFAFTVEKDTWRKMDDGVYERTINQIDKLYDVSVLTCTPAYEETSVSCRSFEEFKEKEARELEEAKKAEQEEEKREQAEQEQEVDSRSEEQEQEVETPAEEQPADEEKRSEDVDEEKAKEEERKQKIKENWQRLVEENKKYMMN